MQKIKMFRQSCASHLCKECLNLNISAKSVIVSGHKMVFCALQRKCTKILLSSEDLLVYMGVSPVSANLTKKKTNKKLGNN